MDRKVQSNKNDIAIVGMACRFPGAKNTTEFWGLLQKGVNAVTEVPDQRWSWPEYFGDPVAENNKSNSKWGGFIDGVDEFDPLFFSVSPAEANYIDPQHRLFLQTAYHAVEDAGYDIRLLEGRKVGVYAGVSKNDYAELMREKGVKIESFISTGTVHSILSNRVSYLFDLRGKSEVVDTACSSFLVALDHAISDLRMENCESAIVGGVNLMMSPTMYISHGKSGMLSSTGACRTFDESADGYVRGEGVGAVFVKRLSTALEDNDNILGVIKGISVSHGGRGNFLTAPRASSQAETLQAALDDGDIDPKTVSYIEAHGTGTPLGDPVEMSGIVQAYGQGDQDASRTCYLSSVKTNIGHLESAASAAGLIKILLCMKHKTIPKVLHFTEPNPHLHIDNTRFQIVKDNVDWVQPSHSKSEGLRAGLSSFGMGGVNAHLVLEKYQQQESTQATPISQNNPWVAIPLSADSPEQVGELTSQLLDHLRLNANHIDLVNVAFTLQTGRYLGKCRKCFVANSVESLINSIREYLARLSVQGHENHHSAESISLEKEDTLKECVLLASRWERGESSTVSAVGIAVPGRRISLPGYPFARRRCWYPELPANGQEQGAKLVAPTLQPKIIASSAESAVRESKGWYLRDHVVQGGAILPAVHYLWLLLGPLNSQSQDRVEIENVCWLVPCTCDQYDSANIQLQRIGEAKGEYVKCVVSGSTVATARVKKLAMAEVNPVVSSLPSMLHGNSETIESEQIYAQLSRSGLDYGKAFRVVRRTKFEDDSLYALLEANTDGMVVDEQFLVPLLDGVFQTVVLLHNALDVSADRLQNIPFMLKRFIWSGIACPSLCIARVRRSDKRNNVEEYCMELCTPEGDVVCQFEGFIKRPYSVRSIADEATCNSNPLHLYTTDWLSCPLGTWGERLDRVVVYGKDSLDSVSVLQQRCSAVEVFSEQSTSQKSSTDKLDQHAFGRLMRDADLNAPVIYLARHETIGSSTSHLNILHLVQEIMRRRVKHLVRILYVHDLSDSGASQAALVAGFARTLNYENPNVRVCVLGLDDDAMEQWQSHVIAEFESYDNSTLNEIRYHLGQREIRAVRSLAPAMSNSVPQAATNDVEQERILIREGGQYLICGGAGGIGARFASYLATEFRASIHLVGRRAHDAAIDKQIRLLEAEGCVATYWQVDIADTEATQRLFEALEANGSKIDGILQCAGLIEDAFILKKKAASFERVLAPKVAGTINLDEFSASHKPDFILLFSSVAALMPNQGQCDYAAANSFLDCFAQQRNQRVKRGERTGRCVAINWPLWADGGIGVSESEEKHLLDVFGMQPMTWVSAQKLFDRVLGYSYFENGDNLIAINGSEDKIRRSLNVIGAETLCGLWSLQKRDESSQFLKGTWLERTEQVVNVLFTEIVGHEAQLDVDANMSASGFNSQSLTTLSSHLNRAFGSDIDPILFFEKNTIRQIAQFLEIHAPPEVERTQLKSSKIKNRLHAIGLIDPVLSEPTQQRYRKRLSNQEYFMRDHVVQGRFNVPGACFVEMAAQAFALARAYEPNESAILLKNNFWAKQLSTLGSEIRMTIDLKDGDLPGHSSYRITCDGDDSDDVYAVGELQLIDREGSVGRMKKLDIDEARRGFLHRREKEEIYRYIEAEGLIVGESFQPMSYALISEDAVFAECHLPQCIVDTADDYLMHPTLLTGVLQAALLNNKPGDTSADAYIPIGIDEIYIQHPLTVSCYIRTKRRKLSNDNVIRKFDVEVYDLGHRPLVQLTGVTLKNLSTTKQAEQIMADSVPQNINDSSQDLHAVRLLLTETIAPSLGMSVNEIDRSENLDRYGLNSILIVELNQRLEELFGSLSKTLLFEYQTVNELSEYFIENYRQLLLDKQVLGAPTVVAQTAVSAVPDNNNSQSPLKTNPHNSGVVEHSEKATPASAGEAQARVNLNDAGSQVETDRRAHFLSTEQDDQSVAIIGLAGRYPGAESVDEFWLNLQRGVDSISPTPINRFDVAGHENDTGEDLIGCQRGGFLKDVEFFDAAFFNISPREAENLDPQERLFLETAWSTIENAGYDHEKLKGQEIGVFVGALWQPYTCLGIEQSALGNSQNPTGLLYNIPNRVSYFFDWSGPSIVVDTACSSSLTALHMACNSIRTGEVVSALAGGVNLSFSSSKYLWLSKNKFLSSEGKCRSFGEGGDGYVPGEGVGAVYLKKLSQALIDGDNIHGIIKASSVNHGGRTNGFTVPNPVKQGELIRKSLDRAGIDAREISYVEAHGTGTSLGDPIEINGLTRAFKPDNPSQGTCAVGSVKSNIGHLEAAAGIAGLTKTLLQIKYAIKVPSLNAEEENQNIDFLDSVFYVQKNLSAWRANEGYGAKDARVAMVSSFGAGGSNAHVIVSEHQTEDVFRAQSNRVGDIRTQLFPFSARSSGSLYSYLRTFVKYLSNNRSVDAVDIACTLQEGRTAMKHRVCFVAHSIDELAKTIGQYLEDGASRTEHTVVATDISRLDGADLSILLTNCVVNVDLNKIRELWELGCTIDWAEQFGSCDFGRTELPTYRFERKLYQMHRIADSTVSSIVDAEAVGATLEAVPGSGYSIRNLSSIYQHNFELHPVPQAPGHTLDKEISTEVLSDLLLNTLKKVCCIAVESDELYTLDVSSLEIIKRDQIIEVLVEPVIESNEVSGLELRFAIRGQDIGVSIFASPFGNKSCQKNRAAANGKESVSLSVEEKLTFNGADRRETHEQEMKILPSLVHQDAVTITDKPVSIQLKELNSAKPTRVSKEPIVSTEPHSKGVVTVESNTNNSELNIDSLRASLAECLYMSADDIDENMSFIDIGLDSIVGVEWIESLNNKYGLRLHASVLYDYPILNSIYAHIQSLVPTGRESNNLAINISSSSQQIPDATSTANSEAAKDISTILVRELANVLFMDMNEVSSDTAFVDLGLDSVVGVEWLDSVNRQLGTELAATSLYDHPNVEKLAQYVTENIEASLRVTA